MHTFRSAFVRSFPVGLALLAAPLAGGCELFVHFDRSRIGEGDASMDGGRADGGADTGTDGAADMGAVDMGTIEDMGAVDMGSADMGAVDTGTIEDMGPADVGTDTGPRPDTGVDAGCSDPLVDCPATGNECVVATCTMGACGTMNLGMTHVLSTGQMAHDCRVVVCDGSGGTTSIADATDVPTTTTACLSGICSGTTPGTTPAGPGTACSDSGGVVCDGAGACVACTMASDCGGGTPACDTATHTCVACIDDTTCSGGTPRCAVASHTCVECLGDGDCSGGTPTCNLTSHVCM